MCHHGRESYVSPLGVQNHLEHGCSLGSCQPNANTKARMAMDVQEASVASLAVYSNPVVSTTTLAFTLAEAGNYQVEVYDMSGSLVTVAGQGSGEAHKAFAYEPDAKGRHVPGKTCH